MTTPRPQSRCGARGGAAVPSAVRSCHDALVTTRGLPYAAYLRVYEPLEAFGEDERAGWSRSIDRAVPGEPGALDRAVAVPSVLVPRRESVDVLVTAWGGQMLACPMPVRARALHALEELRRDVPEPVVSMLVTPAALAAADAVAAEVRRTGEGTSRLHARTSTWQVPIAWFVLVEDSERSLEVHDGRPSLRYRTSWDQARLRLAEGLGVLRATVASPVVPELMTISAWLEAFHPRSLVELDYGGLTEMLDEATLAADHSAADVRQGLDALARGDLGRAGEAYLRLVERWRAAASLEHAN